MKDRVVFNAFFRPSTVAGCARIQSSESRSSPIVKRSSKGTSPTSCPIRTCDVTDLQCREVPVTSFAKCNGVERNNFPASIENDESTAKRSVGSRITVRLIKPEYFSSMPPDRPLVKVRLEMLAPLVQLHRPLGIERISAAA